MNKNLKTAIQFIIFFSIGILLIWLSVKGLSPEERKNTITAVKSANYWWIVLTILLGVGSHLIRANRWKRMLKPLGYNPSLKNTFYAVMIGYFANLAIPRLGEVTRCGILSRYENVPINKSLGTVISERALDLFIFIFLFIVAFFVEYRVLSNYIEETIFSRLYSKFEMFEKLGNWLIIGILVIGLGIFFILWKIRKRFERFKIYVKFKELVYGFWLGLKSVLKMEKAWLFIFETIAIWVLYFLMVYLCFFSLPETQNLGIQVGLAVLVLGSVAVMITPGGIGLYPVMAQQTLMLYGMTGTTGLALGYIAWSAQTLMIIVAGTASLILLSFSKRNKKAGS